MLYFRAGRYLEARDHLEQARDLLRQFAPDDELARAGLTFNLGVMHKALGNYAAAQSAYDDAYAVALRLVGDHHPLVNKLEMNRGSLLLAQGHFAAAERALLRVLAVLELDQPGSEAVAMIAFNLGVAARGAGRFGDAETWLRRALDGRTRLLGASHRDTADTRSALAETLHHLGRGDQALAAFARANADVDGQPGIERQLATMLTRHAGLLLDRGDLDESRQLLERALALHATSENPGDPVETLTRLAELALAQRRHADALALALRAHAAAQNGLEWPQVRADAAAVLARVRHTEGAPAAELTALVREADLLYEAAGPATAPLRAALATLLTEPR